MARRAVSFLMVCGLCAAPLLPGPETSEALRLTDDILLTQLADDVYLHETFTVLGESGRIGANGLVVVCNREAVMIDTPWNDRLTRELCDWFQRVRGVTINRVIVGHSHPDCLGGLAEMHRRGAESYGHLLTAAFARRGGKPIPQTTFSGAMTVRLGAVDLVLRHLGAGHTRDNIVVWIPHRKILFGGCLVKALSWNHLGYMAEGDLDAYPATLRRVIRAFPSVRLVVPGHGAPGPGALLTHTLRLAERKPNRSAHAE